MIVVTNYVGAFQNRFEASLNCIGVDVEDLREKADQNFIPFLH